MISQNIKWMGFKGIAERLGPVVPVVESGGDLA